MISKTSYTVDVTNRATYNDVEAGVKLKLMKL